MPGKDPSPCTSYSSKRSPCKCFFQEAIQKIRLTEGNRGRVLLCLAGAFVTRDKNSFEEMSGKTSLTPPAPSQTECKKTMKIIPLYGKKSPLPKCWGWPRSSSSQPRGKMCMPYTHYKWCGGHWWQLWGSVPAAPSLLPVHSWCWKLLGGSSGPAWAGCLTWLWNAERAGAKQG